MRQNGYWECQQTLSQNFNLVMCYSDVRLCNNTLLVYAKVNVWMRIDFENLLKSDLLMTNRMDFFPYLLCNSRSSSCVLAGAL